MVVMDSNGIEEKGHFIDIENGVSESEESVDSVDNSSNPIGRIFDNGRSLLGERFGRGEKVGFESSREKTRRKPPKPPRPPKSSHLVVADPKLVGEISEHAMLKWARAKRMKAFKKMKKGKTTSSNGYFCALVITIIFCAIIIWQGVFSKSSSRFHGTTESSLENVVEFNGNISTDPLHSSGLKQVPSVHGQGEASRASE